MACESRIDAIQELVDGSLGAIRRADLDQHLALCADCRALKEDLERIREAAAGLPQLRPPDSAWLQIARRLRQEAPVRESAPSAPARRLSYAWLGIAAALVIVTSATVAMLLR